MTRLETKIEAIRLRKRGFSYRDIKKKLNISLSTLGIWLQDIPYVPRESVTLRIAQSHKQLIDGRKRLKIESLAEAERLAHADVGQLSERDLFVLGLGLYMGEGSKTVGLRIVNSDPSLIRLGILWFEKVYNIPLSYITVRLHLYPDCDISESQKYWSGLTGIPLDQFHPVYIDKRSDKKRKNRNKLPFGTAHVTIRSRGNPQAGILLMRRVLASIEITKNQAGLV